jgi:ferredoxin/flavodoxin---NADP+ reductase
MFEVLTAEWLTSVTRRFRVRAPRVALHWRPGQFVIVRVSEAGERIPLTIAGGDPSAGWIELVVQGVGRTTRLINALEPGGALVDLAGPLGSPSEIEHVGTVVVVAGGVGAAIALPLAAEHHRVGNHVIGLLGARSADQLILEHELGAVCHELGVCTDDGTRGRQGLVTDLLADLIGREPVALVVAAGPIPMMAAVAATTRPFDLPTIASLNPIMVDGTGMCGGCRVMVDGRTRFACTDGPEFDAHLVDFAGLALRNRAYAAFERQACSMEAST